MSSTPSPVYITRVALETSGCTWNPTSDQSDHPRAASTDASFEVSARHHQPASVQYKQAPPPSRRALVCSKSVLKPAGLVLTETRTKKARGGAGKTMAQPVGRNGSGPSASPHRPVIGLACLLMRQGGPFALGDVASLHKVEKSGAAGHPSHLCSQTGRQRPKREGFGSRFGPALPDCAIAPAVQQSTVDPLGASPRAKTISIRCPDGRLSSKWFSAAVFGVFPSHSGGVCICTPGV